MLSHLVTAENNGVLPKPGRGDWVSTVSQCACPALWPTPSMILGRYLCSLGLSFPVHKTGRRDLVSFQISFWPEVLFLFKQNQKQTFSIETDKAELLCLKWKWGTEMFSFAISFACLTPPPQHLHACAHICIYTRAHTHVHTCGSRYGTPPRRHEGAERILQVAD